MSDRNYWLDLFTYTTWNEFLDAGGTISGFRKSRWKTMQRIKPGDYFLCYMTGVSRFIGVLEIQSESFQDTSPIWKDEDFPCRVNVKIVYKLEPETAIPILLLKDRLSVFQNLKNPNAWTGHFRGSPLKWSKSDGEVVVAAIEESLRNPNELPRSRAARYQKLVTQGRREMRVEQNKSFDTFCPVSQRRCELLLHWQTHLPYLYNIRPSRYDHPIISF